MINKKLYLLLVIVSVFLSSFAAVSAQEHSNFLLKKIGNLYVINVGANDNVTLHEVYNLYFEQVRRFPILRFKIKTKREFYGAVQVTQLFPAYSVVRILAKAMETEPKGNKIILIRRAVDKETQLSAGEARKTIDDLPVSPVKDMQDKPEEIQKEFDIRFEDPTYKPFSFGFNYVRGLNSFSKPISEDVFMSINEGLYNSAGTDTASYASGGGISFNASKVVHKWLAVEAGVSLLNHKSTLRTSRGEDNEPEIPGIKHVKSLDVDFSNSIKLINLTFHASQYNNANSYFSGDNTNKKYAPRFGLGMQYTSVSVKMDQTTSIWKNFDVKEELKEDKTDMGGYWGWHMTAGVDYYFQAFRFFGELSYYSWSTDKFKSGIPIRFGISLLF